MKTQDLMKAQSMKFNKFLFWLGLRPLTAEVLHDEYLIAVRKRMKRLFEDTIVPELIRYGKYSQQTMIGFNTDETIALKDILNRTSLQYTTTQENGYGTCFRISIK